MDLLFARPARRVVGLLGATILAFGGIAWSLGAFASPTPESSHVAGSGTGTDASDMAARKAAVEEYATRDTGDLSVHVIDHTSGEEWGIEQDRSQRVASSLKIAIADAWMDSQSEPVSTSETARHDLANMLRRSHNEPADRLWQSIGAERMIKELTAELNLHDTQAAADWIEVMLSPRDLTTIMTHVVSSPLVAGRDQGTTAVERDVVLQNLASIRPDQDWGMGNLSGPQPIRPWSTAPDESGGQVWVKNGWLTVGTVNAGRQMNTVGHVQCNNGHSYTVAVMWDGTRDFESGRTSLTYAARLASGWQPGPVASSTLPGCET